MPTRLSCLHKYSILLTKTHNRKSKTETFQKRTAPDGKITAILSFREEKTGAILSLPSYEAVIFCDNARLEKVNWNDQLYDNMIEDLHNMNNDCNDVFMYTDTFENKPDAIQICPWFLRYVKTKKVPHDQGSDLDPR
ncbi:hypothetical protein F4779DRAFT_492103 [Xylariaceae sp. FL0662B]|nr:hypothetical protein F4779DRAFT_492103 [Xylariaceae sp. FL0662B]